jgi:hypothetical protein
MPKGIKVTKPTVLPAPLVRSFASTELEYVRDMFQTATSFSLVDARARRTVEVPDVEAARGAAEIMFHSESMLARKPNDRSLLLYAVKGNRQALIATIFPAGTTSFPALPGRYKEESNQWTTDGEWKLKEPASKPKRAKARSVE